MKPLDDGPRPLPSPRVLWLIVAAIGALLLFAWGWMSWIQSWWPTSAWAGPARPRTAAVSPLAMMVANPNFFIALSFCRLFEPWRESRGSDVVGVGEEFSSADLIV